MNCPFCSKSDSSVKDSRGTENNSVIRRRRYCNKCNGRFTTFERIQLQQILVIKRSGFKKSFNRDKIQKSIATASRKRNISEDTINQIVNHIVLELESKGTREVSSRKIGELIMQELAKIDTVAYIRFASVYKEFTNAQDFAKFVSKLKS